MSNPTNRSSEWDTIPIRPDTKEALTLFKEIAGMTYDEAVAYLLGLVLLPGDDQSLAQAALRVRQERTRSNKQTGSPNFERALEIRVPVAPAS